MLLHLGQNLITLRTLLHLGSFITLRPSTALFCGGLLKIKLAHSCSREYGQRLL